MRLRPVVVFVAAWLAMAIGMACDRSAAPPVALPDTNAPADNRPPSTGKPADFDASGDMKEIGRIWKSIRSTLPGRRMVNPVPDIEQLQSMLGIVGARAQDAHLADDFADRVETAISALRRLGQNVEHGYDEPGRLAVAGVLFDTAQIRDEHTGKLIEGLNPDGTRSVNLRVGATFEYGGHQLVIVSVSREAVQVRDKAGESRQTIGPPVGMWYVAPEADLAAVDAACKGCHEVYRKPRPDR
ncbi:MAG: hypothetical protein AB7K09_19520 [Planctomycetota bacterium]